MTIFVGSFEHKDTFHRIVTIVACASIVITAVYILRVVGSILLGPVENDEYKSFKDAEWNEKAVTVILIIAIVGIGTAPFWLSDIITQSLGSIIHKLNVTKVY
jgi:NADH-quinone oxidoreductase subunit M